MDCSVVMERSCSLAGAGTLLPLCSLSISALLSKEVLLLLKSSVELEESREWDLRSTGGKKAP